MTEELLPYKKLSSEDLERSVVGSIVVSDEAAYFAISQLSEDDFFNDKWKNIFSSAKKIYEEEYKIDRSILEINLSKKFNGEQDDYVNAVNIATNFCNPKEIETYCREMQSYSFRRSVVESSTIIRQKALDLSIEDSDIISELEKTKDLEFENTLDIAKTSAEIKEDGEDEIETLPLNLPEWDEWFYEKGGRGLGTTELIFARPGHGKTYYLNRKIGQIAKGGNMVLHFPLEDVESESAKRIDAVVDPSLQENDNILIISNKRYLHDIIKYIRFYKKKYDIKAVSIDHLGRVKVRGFRADQKVPAMIEASNSLTDECNDLNVHGIISVQPNKSYKQRRGYQNLLREEDLKGATEIFEDAFVVTTLIRPNIYPELRGGIAESAYVKSPTDSESHYDSVFLTQIKNRRQRITDEFLHMVQHGSKLLTEREFRNLGIKGRKKASGISDDIPF